MDKNEKRIKTLAIFGMILANSDDEKREIIELLKKFDRKNGGK